MAVLVRNLKGVAVVDYVLFRNSSCNSKKGLRKNAQNPNHKVSRQELWIRDLQIAKQDGITV
jgi:hypothetical protein